jgi:hypothetical protein
VTVASVAVVVYADGVRQPDSMAGVCGAGAARAGAGLPHFLLPSLLITRNSTAVACSPFQTIICQTSAHNPLVV